MSFQLKTGVRLLDFAPQMALAAMIVRDVYAEFGADCTITSANDSKHSLTSWHYKGRALDFRTKDFNGDKQLLWRNVQKALGADFDVLLEYVGQEQEHLHLEYDPE